MKCPIETGESAELLLAYGTRKLDAETTALLERHMADCPACREFAGNHRVVSEALDAWEGPPVSADFDRRLYQRIEKGVSWWDLLIRPFRPMLVRQGMPIAAAAFVMGMAGVLLQRPATVEPAAQTESAQLESVQPEQVEHALDAMQMLSDFSHQVRAAANESEM
jgi:anti-sigma factor RsiW